MGNLSMQVKFISIVLQQVKKKKFSELTQKANFTVYYTPIREHFWYNTLKLVKKVRTTRSWEKFLTWIVVSFTLHE